MAKQHAPRFLQIVDSARSQIEECTVDDVKQQLDTGESLNLVDVREAHEYERGHLPNAVHLSKGVIERDVEAKFPDVSARLILYCGGGYRSALAALNLQQMGYTNVISMDGGWREWTEKSYPTETR